MSSIFSDVRLFGMVADSPTFRENRDQCLALCYKLVHEEVVQEFLPALQKYTKSPSLENLAEAADGAIDGIYVLAFFLTQMDLPAQDLWDVVQKANMAKFPEGKVLRNKETGKVMKPEGWKPPDLMPLLIEWNSKQQGQVYSASGLLNNPEKQS